MILPHPGGCRMGNSTVVGTATAEVSGNEVVMHVLCGSITDVMNGGYSFPDESKACMGQTDITFRDGSSVGPVFGAGYDTHYEADHSSIVGEDTTIEVTLEGDCVVRYVYGEGYRGTNGTSGTPPGSNTISISDGHGTLFLHLSRTSNLRSQVCVGDHDTDSHPVRLG